MRVWQQWWSGLVAAGLMGVAGVTAVAAADAQFLPALTTREGALTERARHDQIPLVTAGLDAQMLRMGGCFPISSTPRLPTGV